MWGLSMPLGPSPDFPALTLNSILTDLLKQFTASLHHGKFTFLP